MKFFYCFRIVHLDFKGAPLKVSYLEKVTFRSFCQLNNNNYSNWTAQKANNNFSNYLNLWSDLVEIVLI